MSQSSDSSPGRGDRRFLLLVGAALVAVSVVLYLVNYFIFHDGRNLIFYLLIDLAFLPIEVLIVGVIVERLIAIREKSAIAQKLNMVIGAFFSELGTPLLARLLPAMDAAPRDQGAASSESFLEEGRFLPGFSVRANPAR